MIDRAFGRAGVIMGARLGLEETLDRDFWWLGTDDCLLWNEGELGSAFVIEGESGGVGRADIHG